MGLAGHHRRRAHSRSAATRCTSPARRSRRTASSYRWHSGQVIGAYGLTEPEAGSDSGGTRTTAKFERTARTAAAGSSTAASASSPTPARRAPTSSPPGPATREDGSAGDQRVHRRAAARPGFCDRPARGEARPPRQRHRRAALRGLPNPGRPDARREGRRLEDLPQDARRRPHLHRRDGGRALARPRWMRRSSYARERKQFGKPIGSFQGVAFMIADMATEIEAARAMVWRAAWMKDQGQDYGTAAAQAKLFASEVSQRVTNMGVQVHGGYGYVEEYKVERFLRDAKLTELGRRHQPDPTAGHRPKDSRPERRVAEPPQSAQGGTQCPLPVSPRSAPRPSRASRTPSSRASPERTQDAAQRQGCVDQGAADRHRERQHHALPREHADHLRPRRRHLLGSRLTAAPALVERLGAYQIVSTLPRTHGTRSTG